MCFVYLRWWEEIINPKLGQKLTLGSTIGCPTNQRLKCNLDNLFNMRRSEKRKRKHWTLNFPNYWFLISWWWDRIRLIKSPLIMRALTAHDVCLRWQDGLRREDEGLLGYENVIFRDDANLNGSGTFSSRWSPTSESWGEIEHVKP
jgi:hypothetical protein